MKPGYIFLIIFAVVLVIGTITFMIWWFVFKDKTYGSNELEMTSSVLTGESRDSFRSRNTLQTLSECPVISHELQGQLLVSPDALVCDAMPSDWKERTRDFHFHGIHQTTVDGGGKFVFVPRSTNDLVVPLRNVKGKFYSMYLMYETDMWSAGFVPDTKEDVVAGVEGMRANRSKAVCLVGEVPVPAECDPEKAFDFNARNSVPVVLNKVSKESLQPVRGPLLRGCFRISADHCDYEFELGGQQVCVRILIGNCKGQMADKLLYIDGEYKWLDLVTNQFVSVRNPNCLSFWNQPHEGSEEEKEGTGFEDEQNQIMRQQMVTLFHDRRYGMPIELANEEVDFRKLCTHNATIDLLVDSFIGFRNAVHDELSEQDLLDNPVELIKRFDIPNVNFRAFFHFSE